MSKQPDLETKVRVGITHGDINGIGYEIIIKSLSNPGILEMCTPVVYGSSKIASYHKKTLDLPDFNFNLIKSASAAILKRANIINIYDKEVKIDLGENTEIAGTLSLLSLETAVEDLLQKRIDVMVTAPINKQNIQSERFKFPGHTEYLAQKTDTRDYLMLMISNQLRIGVVTGHIPIRNVADAITEELILQKIHILNQSLIRDFAIRRPKIAVLGLNPHAGDHGVLGNEEERVIIPAIKKACDKDNMLVFGPYPADGFFGTSAFTKFDGVLAMYHDQGMIPFKTMSFDNGVNYTAGLPFVRTSPAHGVAYDIAGKNEASPDSFREALYLAIDIFNHRKMYRELTANPLKVIAPKALVDEQPEQLESNI